MEQPVCKIDKGDTKTWSLDGKLHKEDGPAIEYQSGRTEWYLHGEIHREDGPALEDPAYGDSGWYINGELHRENDLPAWIGGDGRIEWRIHDQPHREDGPAILYPDKSEEWCRHGKRHREDGPAYKDVDGSEDWCINGKLHREDGPALIRTDDKISQWWLNNNHIPDKWIDENIKDQNNPTDDELLHLKLMWM